MLPSTGLFKTHICPYFYGGEGISCFRPYCHFKHGRKDDLTSKFVRLHENADCKQPKLLTLNEIDLKKKELEYTPNQPGINVKKSSANKILENKAPVYVPSESLQTTAAKIVNIDLIDCDEEFKELSEIFTEEEMCTDMQIAEVLLKNEHEESEHSTCIGDEDLIIKPDPAVEIVDLKKDIEKYSIKKGMEITRNSKRKKMSKDLIDAKKRNYHLPENRNFNKAGKGQINNKKINQREGAEIRSKSKITHILNGNRYSTLSSSHKSRISTNTNSCLDVGEIIKRRRSSYSTTSGKRNSSPNKNAPMEQPSNISIQKNSAEIKYSTPIAGDIGSKQFQQDFPTSEEEIRRECEVIYDQIEQHFASLHRSEPAELPTKSQKKSHEQEEKYTRTFQYGKRIAHKNSINTKPLLQISLPKPSHMHNAMKSIYQRQDESWKQQQEKYAAIKEAEEKVREANESLRKVQETNVTQLTKTTNLQSSKPNGRKIGPVASILALEKAKKKVEELTTQGIRAYTTCQTASKTVGRVAHTASKAAKLLRPKPPVLDAESTKISYNIRMQYYEIMVEHCSSVYPNIADAWDRAQSEELAVFKKCSSPVVYKNSAMLAINKLRRESKEAGNTKPDNKVESHEVNLTGKLDKNSSWSLTNKNSKKTSLSTEESFDKLSEHKGYKVVYDLRLTEEQLVANGFPRPGLLSGIATILNTRSQIRRHNRNERYCLRCSKVFDIAMYDVPAVDECNYHPKGTGYRRGFPDNYHRCCQQPAGTAGCSYANYHVAEEVEVNNLKGYVRTIDKGDDYVPSKEDIYALDCEMCYTTHGIELTRITVVDINARTVYDALVKPENKIIDYNTTYSGITEQMMENETRNLRDVQGVLLSMFHSKTILVGHSLESDLKALKLIHGVVVDTSVLFPHKMGPPKKKALKTLCIENLKKIIQEDEAGHDSTEDAQVCIQLVKFYLRNRIS